jgi:hypothetical protein
MNSPYNYLWNPVTPNGCRDMIWKSSELIKDVYFMVGPNSTGGYWDPSKISSINVTAQAIVLSDPN